MKVFFKKIFPFWCLYTFFVTISILGREFLQYPSWHMSYIFSPLASQTEIITFYVGYCWFTGTCFRELLVKILESLGNFAVLTWTSCGRYSSSSSFKRLSNCWTATLRISWSGKLKQSKYTYYAVNSIQ